MQTLPRLTAVMKFFAPILFFSACSSVPLTRAGEKVRVVEHRAELGKRCRVMGKLEGDTSRGENSLSLALRNGDEKRRLQNMAGERGDTVYIYQSPTPPHYQAYVLRCHFPLPQHARAHPPAAATSPDSGTQTLPDFSPEAVPEALPTVDY